MLVMVGGIRVVALRCTTQRLGVWIGAEKDFLCSSAFCSTSLLATSRSFQAAPLLHLIYCKLYNTCLYMFIYTILYIIYLIITFCILETVHIPFRGFGTGARRV